MRKLLLESQFTFTNLNWIRFHVLLCSLEVLQLLMSILPFEFILLLAQFDDFISRIENRTIVFVHVGCMATFRTNKSKSISSQRTLNGLVYTFERSHHHYLLLGEYYVK